MKIFIVFAICLCIGCNDGIVRGMTRQEVIEATKECEGAGMQTEMIKNLWTYNIVRVNCLPKEQPDA